MDTKPNYKEKDEYRGQNLSDYWPLFSLIIISALAGWAISWDLSSGLMVWMHYFMGFFLCSFSMLKIFNLSGFADGFQMYDILAKKNRTYAYIYPFLELILGLSYLSFSVPKITYLATIILMTFSAIGVVFALKKGLNINCPCMGSILNVPLSTVTLTEDIGMATMAAAMLIMVII